MESVEGHRARRSLGGWLLVVAFVCSACTATVRAPQDVADPVVVVVVFEARHRGLVLPDAEGRPVEWAYGEWRWYALHDDAWYDGFRAALWPSAGALGRRSIPLASPGDLPDRDGPVEYRRFLAPRAKVDELREQLELQFASGCEVQPVVRSYGFDFTRHPETYCLTHNCNDQLCDWLDALGAEVRGRPVLFDVEVAEVAVGR